MKPVATPAICTPIADTAAVPADPPKVSLSVEASLPPVVISPVPLAVLARNGQFGRYDSVNAYLFTDPPVPKVISYSLATFPDTIRAHEVLARLQEHAFRAATLREVLCILQAFPMLRADYPKVMVYGSFRLGYPEIHPYIECGRRTNRLSFLAEPEFLLPGLYHLIVAR